MKKLTLILILILSILSVNAQINTQSYKKQKVVVRTAQVTGLTVFAVSAVINAPITALAGAVIYGCSTRAHMNILEGNGSWIANHKTCATKFKSYDYNKRKKIRRNKLR